MSLFDQVKYYAARNYTQNQTAAAIGKSRQWVARQCVKHGFEWPGKSPSFPAKIFVTYRGERVHLWELAHLTGINFYTLVTRYRSGDRGAQLVRSPNTAPKGAPAIYELGLSVTEWESIADLARELGGDTPAIKKTSNKLGVPFGAVGAAVRGEWERLG